MSRSPQDPGEQPDPKHAHRAVAGARQQDSRHLYDCTAGGKPEPVTDFRAFRSGRGVGPPSASCGLPARSLLEGQSGEAPSAGGGHAEQAQAGFGEVLDGAFGYPLGLALVETEQTEEPAGHGTERDLGVRNAWSPHWRSPRCKSWS
jgi:hypothetical protein